MRDFCQHSYHGVRVSRTGHTGKSEQAEWNKNAYEEELSSKHQLEYWWMNLSGHYSTTSWISNPLDWFITGAVTQDSEECFISGSVIEKVLGSRTDQHWFIFQNSHAEWDDYQIWSQSMPSARKVIQQWEWSYFDHGFHELVPLLLPPLRLHHHRHRCGPPLRRRRRHRAVHFVICVLFIIHRKFLVSFLFFDNKIFSFFLRLCTYCENLFDFSSL